ncbi:ABC protein [Suillus subaureus]|uniref:ABC protein n=1 Tax=Suillus subaureus TaxID=48587 RepID=A0A9P7EI60_9AGAM|nr:ABC protein [Suillus subaureus]KAG1821818.1 ABC protein [Suillus subaureus]
MASKRSEETVQDEKFEEEFVQDNKVSIVEESREDSISYHQLPTHQLDTGNEYAKFRQKWWQLWLPKDLPPPVPPSMEDAALTPLADASIFSQFTYTWITSLIVLGYQRTLQAPDLYKIDPSRESAVLAAKLEAAWQRRVAAAADWNARLERGELKSSVLKRTSWALRAIYTKKQIQDATWAERRAAFRKYWQEHEGRKEASLTWVLNDVFGNLFWIGGVIKARGFLIMQNIVFAEERSAAIAAGEPAPNIGRGIVMAFGLFVLSLTQSICTYQFYWRSMATGILTRAALITCIYERGVNLTGKARVKLSNATLIDAAAQWFVTWTAPIQVIICLIILLTELGPSALAGLSLFILFFPLQRWLMTLQHRMRVGSMKWTDQRAKVLLEVLGGIRVVKYFSYEVPLLKRIFELRKKELQAIQWIIHAASMNFTMHDFNVAAIFAPLSLFQVRCCPAAYIAVLNDKQILRQPMMLLPQALSAILDAFSAIQRLTHVFRAELILEGALVINTDQEPALVVKDATFEWESFEKESSKVFSWEKGEGKDKSTKDDKLKEQPTHGKDALFRVKNVTMTIPRGQLVAIVGSVGSGKSSLLQGLIGEMRKVSGYVSFGGRIGHCPQTTWVQNATLRNNITFGQPFEESRYWRIVETTCLLPDLQLLPDGDTTEIGERGINLSGGQKQRVNVARALYFDPDIVIFDDPLSAVDARVGKSLFQDAIVGALRNCGVTVILVTHAIHFLSQVDHIYALNNGVITESGTYELISLGGDFARLNLEFGGRASEGKDNDRREEVTPQTGVTIELAKLKSERAREKAAGSGRPEGRLMAQEKRSTGSVSWRVYLTYLIAGRGPITVPVVLFFMVMMQGSQVLNSYTLVWWESNKFDRPNSFYQTLYGCLGVCQAVFTFLFGAGMDFVASYVSRNMYQKSVRNVLYAPMSFSDTTPMGRILSIFGKDIDSIDNQLPKTIRMSFLSLSTVMGSMIIVVILELYFIIAVFFIAIGYGYFAAFYQASAREVKRLDSMLRSLLYVHFSETLTGLPTIRSYGEMSRFVAANRYYVDLEDGALYLVITNQCWLGLRLEFIGCMLVFFVTQIGLVLTYTLSCSVMIKRTADVDNYMNAVERLVEYFDGTTIPQEAPHEIEACKPPAQWPKHGAIEFNNVKMAYRPGLPDVLKGISVKVAGGEKIGVVGRTGAGKSSLMLALFRIVELSGGSITIDDIDISTIGLEDLRSRISFIPQDPLLFSGTIRSNLDPFSQHSDVDLWDVLHRSCLVDSSATSNPSSHSDDILREHSYTKRHDLDKTIEIEGANLSVGERSLLCLARALVKDCKVVVLDEATASVDLDTDSKIQHTIQTYFKDRTLLCIAHRLRTIISYDRILVLDAGIVAEFDTPSNLFKREGGIFRGMCERSEISLTDIETS